jgi:two-component system response regulator PilR (NtrC family)
VPSGKILVVDDELSMREFLEILLENNGYDVTTANGGTDAVAKLNATETPFDLVLTDLKMPQVDGIQLLEFVKSHHPSVEVIMMTAFSTTETAIKAMKLGAFDYLSKPFKVDEVSVVVQRCLDKKELSRENQRLRDELSERYRFDNIIGKSREIRQVFQIIERVARTRTSVLINGETGTGKELVAKAVHYNSPRRDGPFIVVNCGAIPESLMESELFGHVKGSFTGATSDKRGLFQEAHNGSLFLDEIGELSMGLQVKLLRVLQERRVKPVGGTREHQVDVRIIAATNRDLSEEVREDRFRQDLFYRLNVIQVALPPLRERREDIPLLAGHFVDKYREEMGSSVRAIAPVVMDVLLRHPFPGNVRELENVIERAMTFELSDVLSIESLPPYIVERKPTFSIDPGVVEIPPTGMDLEGMLVQLERRYIVSALEKSGGVRTEAAKLLGMSFRSIRYKLDKFGITDDEFET